MIHSANFSAPGNTAYRKNNFDLETGEEGRVALDRPLVAQFCANDKDVWLSAASLVADGGACDAADLNLGCPQGIAKRGRYGAFLMQECHLVESMGAFSFETSPVCPIC
jgi:tRNA-dihydrouridine synthase 1